ALPISGIIPTAAVTQAVAEVQEAIAAIRTGVDLDHLETDLENLGINIRKAYAAYEEAESQAQDQLSIRDVVRGKIAGLFSGGPLGSLIAVQPLLSDLAFEGLQAAVKGKPTPWAQFLRTHHEDVRSVLGGALAPGFRLEAPSTDQVAKGVSGWVDLLVGDTLAIKIERGQAKADQPPTSVAALLGKIDRVAQARGKDSSKIAVTKVTAPDGGISWLVAIPGTMEPTQMGQSTNPADMDTNIRAITGDASAVGFAVVAALADSGVKKGQPVVLAGHSQGGIVSAELAADPEFTSKVTVAGVLTVGSPVSQLTPRGNSQWLSLEHTQDVIPALSGGANQHGRNHTTVVRDLTQASTAAIRSKADAFNGAHGLTAYTDTAQLVDRNQHQSTTAWKQAVAPIMNPRSTATTTDYTIIRQ
ncbi:MAG: hypothetical protein LBO75_02825, partial [Bifidobacteriaceae bacterium]|nr:hypothetical protein [Bifidobacteriaceae bacterium]